MSIKNIQFLIRQGIERVFTTGKKRTDFVGRELQKMGVAHYINPGFRDPDLGVWEGMTWKEIQAQYPDLFALYERDPMQVTFPGGESIRETHDRVIAAWQKLIRISFTSAAIIAHGCPNAMILAHIRKPHKLEPNLKEQKIGAMNKIIVLTEDDARIEWGNRLIYTEDDPAC